MSADSNSPKVKITNNLSHEVDIYEVYNPSVAGEPVPYEYTKLGSLGAGETNDFQKVRDSTPLNAMYTGKLAKVDGMFFGQFPIKVMAAIQFSFDDAPPLEFTIEPQDEQSMVQSFLFHRFSMANPDSSLTKNLYTALKEGSVDKINDFFQSTKNFKDCTLSSWNAVMTWMQMFTSAWQGPYYLYEQAPDPMPTGYIPQLVATLNIQSDASGQSAVLKMCSMDVKGNPIASNPPRNASIVMNGDGTMGDASPGQDVPVTLTPVWMNVIQTAMQDGSPVTNYLIGPAVTGEVAGKKVVSSQTARQIPGQPLDKKKASSFDASFNKLGQTVGLVVGLLFLGEFAMKIFKSAKSKVDKLREKSKSKDDFDKGKEEVDAAPDQDVVSEAKGKEPAFESDSKAVSGNYQDMADAMQKQEVLQSIDDTTQDVENEIKEQLSEGYTPTEDFEKAFEDMQQSFEEAREKAENGDLTEATSELSDASKKINQTLEETGSEMEQWESDSLKQSSETLKEASERAESLEKAQDERDQDLEDESDDSGYDADDESWPETDEIPMEL